MVCWGRRTLVLVLAGPIGVTPAIGAAQPTSAGPVETGRVEGPTNAVGLGSSAADEAWLRRDRKLRTATFATLGISGGLLGGVAIAGGVMASRGQQANDGSPEAGALIGTGVVFGAALLAFAVSGVLWQDHRYKRPASLEPRPELLAADDPRRDLAWVRRDRRLSRGMIGTGAVLGGALAGLGLCLGLTFQPCDEMFCERPPGPALGSISLAALVGVMAVPFTLLAVVRGEHRRPLRKARARVAGGGLRIEF